VTIPADIEMIKEAVKETIKGFTKKTTFRVSAQRIDKSFSLKSMEINMTVGEFIINQTGAKVSLKDFKEEVGIEIIEGSAYIFTKRTDGPGGLPLGVEGNIAALVENKDSLKAALLMMKRGCDVLPFA